MKRDPMQEFHKLIKDERYREARGILETEKLDEKVVEKWTLWLDQIQREDRVLAGVESDKSPNQVRRAVNETYEMLASVCAVVLLAGVCWIVVVEALRSSSIAITGPMAAVMVIAGAIGWQVAAKIISPEHSKEVGAVIAGVLMVLIFTTGFPMYYYDDPPIRNVIAGFLLLYPLAAYLAWHGTALAMRLIIELLRPSGMKGK